MEGSVFKNNTNAYNIVVLKNAEGRLIDYLASSAFNIRKILVYGMEMDLPQLQSELLKIAV